MIIPVVDHLASWWLAYLVGCFVILGIWVFIFRYTTESIDDQNHVCQSADFEYPQEHPEPTHIAWSMGLGILLLPVFCVSCFASLIGGAISLLRTFS